MSGEDQVLEVLDQWDDILDVDDLEGALGDAGLIAGDQGIALSEVHVRVVPCVPGDPIPCEGRVTGMKVAREIRAGVTGLAVFLFVEQR